MADGLFGPTPYEVQQAQLNAAMNRGVEMAKLSPLEAARASTYQAGYQLGGGLGSLLGGEDPQLKRAREEQQLLQGADATSLEGLKKLTLAAQAANNPQLASRAFAQYQALQKQQADVSQVQANVLEKVANTKKLTEDILGMPGARAKTAAETAKLEADVIGKEAEQTARDDRVNTLVALGIDPVQAKGIAANDTAYASYLVSKKIATPPDYAVQAGIEGLPVKPFLSDYTSAEMRKMEKGVFSHKAGIAAAGRTTVINQQEGALAKGMGEDQAKALATARQAASGVGQAMDRLNTLERLNKSGTLFQGPQANASINAANLLSSVGLISPSVAGSLANSEVYNKTAKDLVFTDLEGKLGTGVSNEDRNFIEARIPQLTTSPLARTELIQKIKEIQQSKAASYKDMMQHINENKNLNTYDFSKNMLFKPSTSAPSLTGNALIEKYLPKQ